MNQPTARVCFCICGTFHVYTFTQGDFPAPDTMFIDPLAIWDGEKLIPMTLEDCRTKITELCNQIAALTPNPTQH
jgi:hypothetical protein